MRLRPALARFAAVAALLLWGAGVARAECPYFVIPPATQAAGSARDLIVGTVIDNPGGQVDDFVLRVDLVLRGTARVGEVRRFNMLYPGWPPLTNADGSVSLDQQGRPFMPCAPIRAWKGNVIVLALNALAPDGKTHYNAASWISGGVPFETDVPRTTLAEIKRLAGVPDTATLAQPDGAGPGPGADLLPRVLLAGGLGIGAAIGWRRAAREASTRKAGSWRTPGRAGGQRSLSVSTITRLMVLPRTVATTETEPDEASEVYERSSTDGGPSTRPASALVVAALTAISTGVAPASRTVVRQPAASDGLER